MAQLLRGLFIKQPQIGTIKLDAVLQETHTFSAMITEHPIELGDDVNDYIRPLPDRVTIRGIVSRTPLAAPLIIAAFGGRYRRAFDDLRKLATKGQIFDIVTVKRKYLSMACESLTVISNDRTGETVTFTMQCRRVRQVSAFGIDPSLLEEFANALDLGDASLL